MAVRVEQFSCKGGLDLVTPTLELTPGSAIEAVNYELLPEGGYRRVQGYALYDGSETPAAVPGEGIIRGVWVYQGTVYAFRDQATEGGMFKASASGWQAVSLGNSLNYKEATDDFAEGDTVTGVTSGATADVLRVVYAGGLISDGSAFGLLVLDNIVGTFQDNEALSNGTNIAKADGTQYANTLPKGGLYDFENHNFYGQDGSRRMYGANGVGLPFEFDGTVFVPIENGVTGVYPKYVKAHKNHLMQGYEKGTVISSSIGNPLEHNAVTGASEIAVGDAINGLHSLAGGVLAIGCEDSINLLYGNDASNWAVQQLEDHGVRPRTFGEIGGNILVLDNRGVQNLKATQVFGDFESVSQSRKINPVLLDAQSVLDATASVVTRKNSQYRLFYGDAGYYFTYAGDQLSGVMPVQFDHRVEVACTGEDPTGREIMFFGSEDGKVFQMDSGATFDGTNVLGVLRLAFNHFKSPSQRKQYRRLIAHITTEEGSASFNVRADFDFAKPDVPSGQSFASGVLGPTGGGLWDAAIWDDFDWDAAYYAEADVKLQGLGKNVSIAFISDGSDVGTHTIHSVALHFSPRRLVR